jgi:sporulation protein YlmC with PRC-barrel domain
MKKLTLIAAMSMVLAIALWTINPVRSFARTLGSKAGIAASEHVSGVVIGKKIRNDRGVVLGTVKNIVLNPNGCAQYLILSGRFRGARARLYPIPWTVIERVSREFIFVNLDPAVLVKAPSFEVRRWPDFSRPQWQAKIRTFYEQKVEKTVPGTAGKPSGGLSPEQKAKTEHELKAKQKQEVNPTAKGTAPTGESLKGKKRIENEHKHVPSHMNPQGAVETPKQSETNIKPKQHMPNTPGMMEQGKTGMMERGQSEQKKLEKKHVPGNAGVPAAPGKTDETTR